MKHSKLRRTLLLDLDGVIIPSPQAILAYFSVPVACESEYPDGFLWDIQGATNLLRARKNLPPIVGPKDYWGSLTRNFWASLGKYPLADELINWLYSEMYDVRFCTACVDEGSIAGRYAWVAEHYPMCLNTMIITTDKAKLAEIPGAILVDDRDKNVEEFRENGGKAVLVERPWNKGGYRRDPYNEVARQLVRIQHGVDQWEVSCD